MQDSAGVGVGVVEAGVGGEVVEGTGGACFGIWGGIDQAAYAGSVEGAGAHEARLEGGIEGTVGEAPAPRASGGATESEEFGMGGRVFRDLALIVGSGQDLFSPGDHGADGDLAQFGGTRSLFEGTAHKPQIPGSFGFEFFVHGSDDSNTERYDQQRGSPLPYNP